VGCCGFAREITEADRASEQLYRLFNLSLQMLCIAGTDGYFKRVNPAFERTLGYNTSELLAEPFVHFVHADDQQATLDELERLAHGTPSLHFENRFRCKDGSYRWLAWTSMPEEQEGLLYATALDITERKRAEQLFRSLLDSAPDAMIIVDSGGEIVLVNQLTEEMFGYSRENLVGQAVEIVIPERLHARHSEHRAGYVASPRSRAMGAGLGLTGRRLDGSEFPVEVSLSPVPMEEGILVFSSIRDISERKRLERALSERDSQLLAAQKIQQRLLPQSPPPVSGLDLSGVVFPAEFAAGDHFDYIRMCESSLGVVIGDVSGHGFSSALLMASTHELLRSAAALLPSPGEVLKYANSALVNETEDGLFVTILFLKVDLLSRTLVYANAGHPTGYLLDASGKVKAQLNSNAIPIAILEDAEFPTSDPIAFNAGDVLFMVTDGILEAQSPNGEFFGQDRAIQTVRAHIDETAANIVDSLCATVRIFSGNMRLSDDVTVVVLKVNADS
jgi:PAS domain S-box-containing protein